MNRSCGPYPMTSERNLSRSEDHRQLASRRRALSVLACAAPRAQLIQAAAVSSTSSAMAFACSALFALEVVLRMVHIWLQLLGAGIDRP
jgi:hypothetical protein